MISFVPRTVTMAATQVVPNGLRPLAATVPAVVGGVKASESRVLTGSSMARSVVHRAIRASIGLASSGQVRFAHTDIPMPDFTAYRRDSVKESNKSSQTSDASRKTFTYLMISAGCVPAVYAAKTIVHKFVTTWSASADVLALAQVEVKLADIPEGKNMTIKWRGKPLFVRHRSEEEINKEADVDITSLRDPQHDIDRVQKPEWLVLIGVCTHLGCVPIANAGEYGGYYCPCHGSHYDSSGRIRKGPAPLNLEIPEYIFTDESTLLVG